MRFRTSKKKLVRDRPIKMAFQELLAKSMNSLALVYLETGRHKQAVDSYHQAEEIWRKLISEHPKTPTYVDGLATSYLNRGIALENLHSPDEAKIAYIDALKLREKLARDVPRTPYYQDRLALTLNNLAQFLAATGQPTQALTLLRTASQSLEKLVRDYPTFPEYQVTLGNTYNAVGKLENQLGNQQAALDFYGKAIHKLQVVLKADPKQTFARRYLNNAYLERMMSLARMEKYTSAIADVELLARQNLASSIVLYNLACVCSLCSAAARRDSTISKAEQDRLAEQYAARAVDFLNKAMDAGFFRRATALEEMQKGEDLVALRKRRDFQMLLRSLQPKNQPKDTP